MRAILVPVIVLMTACVASPSWVERPARAASAKLKQPTRPLSSFAEYELKPMVFSNVIVENAGTLKQAQELQSLYNGKILPLFESWHADGSGLLLVETELISMRIVSRVMRFFGGLSMAEVADALGMSKRRAEAEWTMVKAWMRRELSQP